METTTNRINFLGRPIYFLKWSLDKWNSVVHTPFTHPDKVGHLFAHFIITSLWMFLIPDYRVLFIDLWINTQVEVMDGTRPRYHLFSADFRVCFENQPDYDNQTIEGFSWKDLLSGIIGSLIAFFIWR